MKSMKCASLSGRREMCRLLTVQCSTLKLGQVTLQMDCQLHQSRRRQIFIGVARVEKLSSTGVWSSRSVVTRFQDSHCSALTLDCLAALLLASWHLICELLSSCSRKSVCSKTKRSGRHFSTLRAMKQVIAWSSSNFSFSLRQRMIRSEKPKKNQTRTQCLKLWRKVAVWATSSLASVFRYLLSNFLTCSV